MYTAPSNMFNAASLIESQLKELAAKNEAQLKRASLLAQPISASQGLLEQELALAHLRKAYQAQMSFPNLPSSALDFAIESLKARRNLALLGEQQDLAYEAVLASLPVRTSLQVENGLGGAQSEILQRLQILSMQRQAVAAAAVNHSNSTLNSSNSTPAATALTKIEIVPEAKSSEQPQRAACPTKSLKAKRGKGMKEIFPQKLHRMLREVEAEGKSDIISFFDNGQAFIVRDVQRFGNEVLPNYFKHGRWTSFHRQLKMYVFQRIKSGPFEGGYFHEKFRRENAGLCGSIGRVGVNASTTSEDSLPDER